jgi:hypothetical protein
MNDYATTRTIGDFTNSGATAGTDTWVTATFIGNGERVRPVLGITSGFRQVDGYSEAGSAQTARTVTDSNNWYTYGTVGAQATIKEGVTAQALHHTDGVDSLSLIVKKDLEKDTTLTAGVTRSISDNGAANSVIVGLVKKF